MDLKHFEKKLLDKQHECEAEIAALDDESREGGSVEVKDEGDAAVSELNTSDALQKASLVTEILEQVRDALQRIKDGTYGKCIECGRQIEPARLEAVPWTPYCREDQEKRDKLAKGQRGPTL